jgi:tetratricopeptide (TPR) repeat protein
MPTLQERCQSCHSDMRWFEMTPVVISMLISMSCTFTKGATHIGVNKWAHCLSAISSRRTPGTSRIAVASFISVHGSDALAEAIPEQIFLELRRFDEEQLSKLDIVLPGHRWEIVRTKCIPRSHEEAQEIGKTINVDSLIWGRSYGLSQINADSAIVKNVTVDVGQITAGDHSSVTVGTIQVTPRSSMIDFSPSITIINESSINNTGDAISVRSLSEVTLNRMSTNLIFRLVALASALRFSSDFKYVLAARFFELFDSVTMLPDRSDPALMLHAAMAYESAGRADTALIYIERALQFSATRMTLEQQIELNNYAAIIYWSNGRFIDSEKYFRLVEQQAGQLPGDSSFSYLDFVQQMRASIMHAQGNSEDALSLLEKLRAVQESRPGRGIPFIAETLHQEGRILINKGRCIRAMTALADAVGIAEKRYANDTNDQILPTYLAAHASATLCIVRKLNDAGQYEDARDLARVVLSQLHRAEEIYQQHLGSHPHLITPYNLMSVVYGGLGEWKEAALQAENALSLSIRYNSTDWRISMVNLWHAAIFLSAGWADEASGVVVASPSLLDPHKNHYNFMIGDVIVSCDGAPVSRLSDLQQCVQAKRDPVLVVKREKSSFEKRGISSGALIFDHGAEKAETVDRRVKVPIDRTMSNLPNLLNRPL